MKNTKLLVSFFACFLSLYSNAQVIKGGALENWNTVNYENPNNWFTSNDETAVRHGVVSVTKVTGMTGQALRMETKDIDGEIFPAYMTNSDGDPTKGEGGFAFSQKPDSMVGYYQSDVKSGDTAIIIVLFKKLGTPISADIYKITGTTGTFTRFAFKINYLLPLTPDSVIIAASSSNALEEIGMAAGSMLTLDKLEFVGTGITQTINSGGFDNWTALTHHRPIDWETEGPYVVRTTDSYKGTYAAQLKTLDEFGEVQSSRMTNGEYTNNGQMGGEPYTGTSDTLIFYYKYAPTGSDSGECYITFLKNGAGIGGNNIPLPAASNWTEIKYAFTLGTNPDTVQITFGSSTWPYTTSNIGSSLTVDEVQFASSRLHTSIAKTSILSAAAYPNPASDNINISLGENALSRIEIFDVNGRLVAVHTFEVAVSIAQIDVSNLNSGLYFVKAVSANGNATGQSKFIRE